MKHEVVFHTPRVTERVIAAAVSKQDRTRHVIRVPNARIVDVESRSQTTRVVAPHGEWVDVVRSIDRRARAVLPEWTEKHDIKAGNLAPSVCSTGGSVFFTLKNQPDAGRGALKTVCDITAELSDIKRGSGDDAYRLVWRVLEADFKEKEEDGWDDDEEGAGLEAPGDDGPSDDEEARPEAKSEAGREAKSEAGREAKSEACREVKSEAGREAKSEAGREAKSEATAVGAPGDGILALGEGVPEAAEVEGPSKRTGLEGRPRGGKLADISTELHSLAQRIRELEGL